MGIIALVIFSVTLAWTAMIRELDPNSPGQVPHIRQSWLSSGRVLSRLHAFQPPARKSVVVDISGMEHQSADNTRPTKRDRSKLYPFLDIQPLPAEEIVTPSTEPAPTPPSLAMALRTPLHQGQIEEIPLSVAPILNPPIRLSRDPSIGRKVQEGLLSDRSLSTSVTTTLRVTSNKDRVTLKGIVLDQEEKEYIGEKAGQIAGPENVDNQLTIL